jgi:hypothetical protein
LLSASFRSSSVWNLEIRFGECIDIAAAAMRVNAVRSRAFSRVVRGHAARRRNPITSVGFSREMDCAGVQAAGRHGIGRIARRLVMSLAQSTTSVTLRQVRILAFRLCGVPFRPR